MTAGLYHSAQSISDDTCLYLENFAFRVASSSHLDATTKAQVTLGFEYYLGLDGNTTALQIAGDVRCCASDHLLDTILLLMSCQGCGVHHNAPLPGGKWCLQPSADCCDISAPVLIRLSHHKYLTTCSRKFSVVPATA